ncbi:hypothetical protein RHSIM_RhsimUnG0129200 [Rhododendron simsii]|uniref:Peptidase M17 leucyl aminopeptidase N-terminal domain-containing protein n=1 Tax=Rhododendron simsii TaxID=118357 RepID=A0A834L2I4_RHOSS|nr:hypothetical protein RHSIM_RhsimUnG0129200 [Rhododendron simsii]
MEDVQQPRSNPNPHHYFLDSTTDTISGGSVARGADYGCLGFSIDGVTSFLFWPEEPSSLCVSSRALPLLVRMRALLFMLCHEAFHKFSMGFCIESLRKGRTATKEPIPSIDNDTWPVAFGFVSWAISRKGDKKISFSAKEIDVVEWKGDILAVDVIEKDMVKYENLKFQNPILKKLDSHMSAKASQASNVVIVIASPEGLSDESKLNTTLAIVSVKEKEALVEKYMPWLLESLVEKYMPWLLRSRFLALTMIVGKRGKLLLDCFGLAWGLILRSPVAFGFVSWAISRKGDKKVKSLRKVLEMFSFSAKEIDAVEWKGDMLAAGVTEKDMVKDENLKFENPILKKLDSHLSGLLAEASLEEDFNGKAGQSTVLRLSGIGLKWVGLIGLGQSTSTTAAYRSLGESVASGE